MSVNVEMKPVSKIIAELGIDESGRVSQYFTTLCVRYMDKYVPYENGGLRNNIDIGPDYVVYKSPDAHYQYVGELYVDPITGKGSFYNPSYGHWSRPGVAKIASGIPLNYHTAGTGSYWDKKMWTAEGQDVIKETQAYSDRGGK